MTTFYRFPFLLTICLLTYSVFCQAQEINQLENDIVNRNKTVILVIVDHDDFKEKNEVTLSYKERYSLNVAWFKENWYEFSKSVREKNSYQLSLNKTTYNSLSEDQKNILEGLYNTHYTGHFNPIGIAKAKMSKLIHNRKYTDELKEELYKKIQLADEDINTYKINKHNTVLVLSKENRNLLTEILK